MGRLTKKIDNRFYIEDDKIAQDSNGCCGEAVDKLALFENIYYDLDTRQAEISKELESLRQDGKTNSYKFKELMGNKLINTNIISLFKRYGVE